MPITIRELVIRTSIPDISDKRREAAAAKAERPDRKPDLETVVQMCVTQVMERLREHHER